MHKYNICRCTYWYHYSNLQHTWVSHSRVVSLQNLHWDHQWQSSRSIRVCYNTTCLDRQREQPLLRVTSPQWLGTSSQVDPGNHYWYYDVFWILMTVYMYIHVHEKTLSWWGQTSQQSLDSCHFKLVSSLQQEIHISKLSGTPLGCIHNYGEP